jgi:hypothetical protein
MLLYTSTCESNNDNFNADRLIEFMDALIKDSRGKVILILDNLRIHHSAPVK